MKLMWPELWLVCLLYFLLFNKFDYLKVEAGAIRIDPNSNTVFKFLNWETVSAARRTMRSAFPQCFYNYQSEPSYYQVAGYYVQYPNVQTIHTTAITYFNDDSRPLAGKLLMRQHYEFFELWIHQNRSDDLCISRVNLL
jgi:hypothetical protein